MTLILETPQSDIHLCPACNAHCAVERESLVSARNAGQRVKIACHKCDEVFAPESTPPAPIEAADVLPETAQNPPNPTPEKHQTNLERLMRPGRRQTQPRAGTCIQCGGQFSLPPLSNFGDVIVECPHCTAEMDPTSVGRIKARDEVVSATATRMAELHNPPRWTTKRVLAVLTLICAGLLAFAGGALFDLAKPASDNGMLPGQSEVKISVTDASFRQVGADGAVLVTVTLSNLGAVAGSPDQLIVDLVDAKGVSLVSRPIASSDLELAPGEVRNLVTRMPAPAGLIDQVRVNMKTARPN